MSCVDRKITLEHSCRVDGTCEANSSPFPGRASEKGRLGLGLGSCFVPHSFFQSTIFFFTHPWARHHGVEERA